MLIIERISQTLVDRNKMAVDLCKELGIQTSTMSTWKSRKKDPPAAYMPTIARFLGVSLDYLITGKEAPVRKCTTAQEDELLELFRRLPDAEKNRFIGMLEGYFWKSESSEKYADEREKLSV